MNSLEQRVGNPLEKWKRLQEHVEQSGILSFAHVQNDWLELMWTLDIYRVERTLPDGFKDFGAFNRGKGNWFAEMVCLLLANRTHHNIAPRQKVGGFSQQHQVDVAWPARGKDPLICCETKVTGAPAFGSTPARGAMSDFSNRRKELKFAATDLKLYRRQEQTKIAHWDVWRRNEPPKTYFLWAARLDHPREKIESLVREARILADTYLDGAGLFAWRRSDSGEAYEPVSLPSGERVTSLDDVIYRIASEIESLVDERGDPPPPIEPPSRALALNQLADDHNGSADG